MNSVSKRYLRLVGVLALLLATMGSVGAAEQAQQPQIVVNGRALTDEEIGALIQLYGQVYVGRYWYDPFSGLYGYEGQGAAGQLMPGMEVGGRLSAAASGGGNGRMTGVFINGREIHPTEYRFLLQLYGQVIPGRYWMNAQGIGGFENGPPFFNVAQQMRVVGGGAYGGGRNDSHYMPWIGAQPGTHVGRASDGCVYVSQGGYSNDFC